FWAVTLLFLFFNCCINRFGFDARPCASHPEGGSAHRVPFRTCRPASASRTVASPSFPVTVTPAARSAVIPAAAAIPLPALRTCARNFEQVALSVHFAGANPHFHAKDTHFGDGFGQCVIDIGTESMQRDASLLVGFAAGHFGAAHTAGYLDFDTLGPHTHRRSDGGLHGTAVRYAAFELTGDVVGHNHRIHLRTLHLEDVYLHFLAGEFLELFFQFVHFLTALADDDARTCRRNGYGNELQRPFYDNFRDTCLG